MLVQRVKYMSKLAFWWALAVSSGAALPARAAAEARPLVEALEVRPGAACLQRETLAAQLTARLGEPKLERALSIVVMASADDARDVSFELRRGSQRLAYRSFFPAPEGCASLAAILTLAIAMALKVSLVDGPTEQRTRSPAKPIARSSLAALAELGLGLLPGVSGGLSVRAEQALHPRFSLRFYALGHTSQDRALDGGAAGRFAFAAWLAAGRLSTCLLTPLARVLVARVCAGFGAGALRVAGHGYRGARAAWLPWLGIGAGAELSIALSTRFTIDGGANLEVPLGKRSFGLRNEDGSIAVSRTLSTVAATLRVGPAYHF